MSYGLIFLVTVVAWFLAGLLARRGRKILVWPTVTAAAAGSVILVWAAFLNDISWIVVEPDDHVRELVIILSLAAVAAATVLAHSATNRPTHGKKVRSY